jgi:hypothetical protein
MMIKNLVSGDKTAYVKVYNIESRQMKAKTKEKEERNITFP